MQISALIQKNPISMYIHEHSRPYNLNMALIFAAGFVQSLFCC
jgi:hypothetical protein